MLIPSKRYIVYNKPNEIDIKLAEFPTLKQAEEEIRRRSALLLSIKDHFFTCWNRNNELSIIGYNLSKHKHSVSMTDADLVYRFRIEVNHV